MAQIETQAADEFVVLGKIATVFGVKGWVKVHSFTDPISNLLQFNCLWMKQEGSWRQVKVLDGRVHDHQLVLHLEGYDDRNAAELLRGVELAVTRSQLPDTPADQFYWVDLQGMRVVTLRGEALGQVDHLLATGANDVLVVRGDRERLIPFVPDIYVHDVDLDARVITVDWDPND